MRKIGHRGAPHEFPANTLQGFVRAAQLGCDMVECDVRRAADGVLVLAHDAQVQDTAGQVYELARHTSTQLHSLDLGAGEGVPTLQELVDWAVRAHIAVMADMKCEGDGIEEAVCAALMPLPPEAKIVPGAGEDSRHRFRIADPFLPLSLSLGKEEEAGLQMGGFDHQLQSPEIAAVTWHYSLLTPERIHALKALGLHIYAWTVDDREVMHRLREDGVDGIISNRPDLLSAL